MNAPPCFAYTALTALAFLAGSASPAPAGRTPVKPPPVASDTKPEGPRLNNTEALRIAREELARMKVDLERYHEPTVTYYRKDKRWFISFMGKKPMPGNHFSVSIDDRTGKARFRGGT